MSLLDLVAGAHEKVLRPAGGCHNCPRKLVDHVPALLRQGSVLFVGEAPGETDVAEQEPFTGAGGTLLRKAANRAGIPEPWSFTTTVHCRPPSGTPSPKEVGCCLSQYVLNEIRGYPIVVLVGNVALQALFPGAKADHFRGNVARHPDFPGQRFYSIYAPAHILRRPDLDDEFAAQLERLGRIARGEPAPEWTILGGPAALPALRKAVEKPLLSLDFETTGLEAWQEGAHIKSCAVTTDAREVIIGHEDVPGFDAMLDLLAAYVSQEGKSVVGSNIAFDLVWLEYERGIRAACQVIYDTQIIWYHAGQYKMPSLKALVAKELDGYRHLIHNPHEMADPTLLTTYNAEDVVHPVHLLRKGMTKLRPKTRDLVTRVLGPTSLILQRMTAHGFYVRDDYRRAKIEEYAERRRQLIAAWKEEDPEFIPHEHESGNGLKKYLFDIRKVPVLERTDSGEPSTDKSAIKQWIRDGHTILRYLLEVREIDKIDSTYLSAYGKILWPDSRIRSSYTLTWTDSGRTSSNSPNLQNIPRKREIRDLFGAPPGRILIESDLSQMEFRIMVCLAKDENGIAGYLRGEDAHTMTARKIAGVDKPTKEQRSNAKPVNFMFLYGGQWFTAQKIAADDYGVVWSDKEAQWFRETFMATYPAVPVFHEASKQKLIANRGWFESVLGHVFYYSDWNARDDKKRDHAFRAALNAEAQGPCAQMCFYIMVLARRMLDARGMQDVAFVNHVHDSIMTEVPNPNMVSDVLDTLTEAAALVQDWVKDWYTVPLILEHAVGESWGSLQEVKHG